MDTQNIKPREEKLRSGSRVSKRKCLPWEVSLWDFSLCMQMQDHRGPGRCTIKEMRSSINREWDLKQFKFHTRLLFMCTWGRRGREGERTCRNSNKTDPMFSLFCQSWIHAPVSLTGENTYIFSGSSSFLGYVCRWVCVTPNHNLNVSHGNIFQWIFL